MSIEDKTKKIEMALTLMRLPFIKTFTSDKSIVDIVISNYNMKHLDRVKNTLRQVCGNKLTIEYEYPDPKDPSNNGGFAARTGVAVRMKVQIFQRPLP